jgi:hypothetical protein
MKVSDLSKDRKELHIAVGDDSINLVYNPKAYTIEVEEQLEAVEGSDFKAKALAIMLEPMLLEWDIVLESPGDFPPTMANLKKLPVEVLGKIIEEIGNASRPSSAEGQA